MNYMIESSRILLRPWQDSDAEALYKYASDPIVGERAGWPPHKSVEESLEIIRKALKLMLDYIRKETTYTSLICSHFIDNPASGRVMEKCGFVPTGETAIDDGLYSGESRLMKVLRLEII